MKCVLVLWINRWCWQKFKSLIFNNTSVQLIKNVWDENLTWHKEFWLWVSSVDRGAGGSSPPHWPEKYAKWHVFSAFEADFFSKHENSLPEGIWWPSCEGFAVIRAEEPLNFRFRPKNPSQFWWGPFFLEITCFWAEKPFQFPPKNQSQFRIQFRINRLNLIRKQWKFGSRSLTVVSLFQKSPPSFPNPSYAPAWGR